MKLNNKGFAFSTMLYGTLAIITVVLYVILSVAKDSVDTTYYYGSSIEKKLNDCVQDEIDMENCYTQNGGANCDPTSYHACLGVSDDPSSVKGEIVSEKLKETITDVSINGLKADPYNNKRYIYVGTEVNNYIEYANKIWRIVSIEPNGTLRLIDYSINQVSAWDVNGNDNWESSTLSSYINSKYLSNLVNLTGLVKDKWFAFYIHSTLEPTISEIILSQESNLNNQNGSVTTNEYNVGLLSVVDYIKATTNADCHSKPLNTPSCTSWLSSYKGWTLDLDQDSTEVTMIYYMGTDDTIVTTNATEQKNFYPIVILDRNSVIIGGSGTSGDPYRVK